MFTESPGPLPSRSASVMGLSGRAKGYYFSYSLCYNWDSVLFSNKFLIVPESPSPLWGGIYWSVFIPISKKGNAKKCSNYRTIALIPHASKVMLKILQARLQQYVNCELPDVQAGFRKGRGTEIKLPTSSGSSKKQESSRKTSIYALLTMPKPLTVWVTINCGKFWKTRAYQITWPAS